MKTNAMLVLISGMLLTGCAAPEEKISFLPFPEGSPVVEDVTPHLEMDAETVLLPTYLPGIPSTESVMVNTTSEYRVFYGTENSQKQAEMVGEIQESPEDALYSVNLNLLGILPEPPENGIRSKLRYENDDYYFRHQADDWLVSVFAYHEDDKDAKEIALTVGEYLTEAPLPFPVYKGSFIVDYTVPGDKPYIYVVWCQDNQVYEFSTFQTPINSLWILHSLK